MQLLDFDSADSCWGFHDDVDGDDVFNYCGSAAGFGGVVSGGGDGCGALLLWVEEAAAGVDGGAAGGWFGCAGRVRGVWLWWWRWGRDSAGFFDCDCDGCFGDAAADGAVYAYGELRRLWTKGPWLKPFILRARIQGPEGPCSLRPVPSARSVSLFDRSGWDYAVRCNWFGLTGEGG